MSEINKRIREIREHLGMTRPEFAEAIGSTAKKIQNVEQELQRVQDDTMEGIAKKFPQFAYWLLTGKVLPEAGQISPEIEKAVRDSQREKKVG